MRPGCGACAARAGAGAGRRLEAERRARGEGEREADSASLQRWWGGGREGGPTPPRLGSNRSGGRVPTGQETSAVGRGQAWGATPLWVLT